MSLRMILPVLLMCAPLSAAAQTPNVQPGQWEYTNVTSFEGEMGIPDQRHNHTECVTHEEIERGRAFVEDIPDECDISNMEMGHDGMSYDMACAHPDGSEMNMSFDMEFMGDRVEGIVTGAVDTPMGQMNMNISVEGEHVGDC